MYGFKVYGLLTKSENMIRYTPADLKEVVYLITQFMSRQVFLDTLRVIADEAEAKINTDLDGLVNEGLVRVSGPNLGSTRERLARKSNRFKENMRDAFQRWLEESVENPAIGVDPLCISLNRHINKSDREVIPEKKRAVFLDTLGAFRERVLAALALYKDSDEQGTVPYAGTLLDRLKKEEEEALSESSHFPLSENFKLEYRQVTGRMAAEVAEVFTLWARRVQRGSGVTIVGSERLDIDSPDLRASSQSIISLTKEICEKWLDHGAWIGTLYRSLFAFGRSQEILRIPGLARGGATGLFRFGEVVRSVVEKYEPQITDLYRKERGDFVVPDNRPERLSALIYEIRQHYAEVLNSLVNAFEKWIADNRHDPRPQAYEANMVDAFNVYIAMLRELLQSWLKTILVEEAPSVGELSVDLIRATEAYEKRERRFLLIQGEGSPKPKDPDFKLVERATGLAQALFASLGDVMIQYPDLLEDLPRLPPQEAGAELDEQKRKKEAASEVRSMMEEAWRLARIEFDEWTAQVEAQPGFPGGSTWKPSAIRSFEEVKGILDETLFIWERKTTFSAHAFWRCVSDVLYAEARIEAFPNSSLAINCFTLPTSFSPIFVQLQPRFQAAMQLYYEADEALSPQLAELKLRADEIVDGYIKSFEKAAQDWLREQGKYVQPQKISLMPEAFGTHVDFIRCLKERTLHGLVIGEVPSFESLYRGIVMYAQEAVRINCYRFKVEDFIRKKVRGRAAFPVLELSEDLVEKMKRELGTLLDEYPAIMHPVRKASVIPPPPQELEEGPKEAVPESELTDDPPAYAEILQRGRRILEANKEKVDVIENKTGTLTGIVRLGQACIHNFKRLLDCPLEHTIRQAQMIVEHMECFLELHEVNPTDQTVRGMRRREGEFARKFLEIGLMSGVEPGVVDLALKEGQAAMDLTLIRRQECLDKLDEMNPSISALRARIEQYNLGIDRAALSLARFLEEQSALVLPMDGQIEGMELAIAELEPVAGEGDLDDLKNELQVMKEARTRGEELLNEIPRLETNLAATRVKRAKAQEELDGLTAQQTALDQQVASIEAQQSLFRERVLEAVQGLLIFSNQLKHD